jgi:hypothetical protein
MERKSNKGQRPKSRQTNSSKEASHKEERGPTKNQTLKSVDNIIDMFQLVEMKYAVHITPLSMCEMKIM